ncbi:MAG: AI-2E family transporter, partial [Pseudomonadota bacterium]|nr:AI-2E family transporter [Pseudomonadota bacterium]
MTRWQQVCTWSIVIIIIISALYAVSEILLPFLVGMAIAYFLDPVLDYMERIGFSRLLATITVTLFFFLLVILIVLVLAPILQEQLVGLARKFPLILDNVIAELSPYRRIIQEYIPKQHVEDFGNLSQSLSGQAVKWILGLVKGLFVGGMAIFNILSLIFITPVICFYFLRDWDKLVSKVDSWLPRNQVGKIRELSLQIDVTIAQFVRGQSIICLLLAVFYSIGLIAIGLDFGLLIGLISGLISFIPLLGVIIGLLLAGATAFFQFGEFTQVFMVLLLFLIGQILEVAILTPKLVGESIGLHPVWVILSLLAGGALFGFLGVLLAIPVAASIGVIMRALLAGYLQGP